MSDHVQYPDYWHYPPPQDDAAEECPAQFPPTFAGSLTPFGAPYLPAVAAPETLHPGPIAGGGWMHPAPLGQLAPPVVTDDWRFTAHSAYSGQTTSNYASAQTVPFQLASSNHQ